MAALALPAASAIPSALNEEISSKESIWKPPWLLQRQFINLDEYETADNIVRCSDGRLVRSDSDRDAGSRNFSNPCKITYLSRNHGPLEAALEALHHSSRTMEWLSMDFVFQALQESVSNRCLSATREIHSLLVVTGSDVDAFITCHLIRAYASLDDLQDALRVFVKACRLTKFSWSAIISAHANLGHAHEALNLYKEMQVLQVELDGHAFVAALKACTCLLDLREGEAVYGHIIALGLQNNTFAVGFLIGMYVECGSVQEATIVFQTQPRRDAASWNALIAGFAKSGEEQIVLQLFFEMQQNESSLGTLNGEEALPDTITYLHVLKVCASLAMLELGQLVHIKIIEKGLEGDLSIGNTLIDMYGKCGSMNDASALFHSLPTRDVVSWSVLISRHTQHGRGLEALKLFKQMQAESIQSDHFTFVCALKACSLQAAIDEGKELHKHIVAAGIESDKFIVSTLIDMYSKCERCSDARDIFDRLQERSLVTWNAMIAGYEQHGEVKDALCLFEQMRPSGTVPDQASYVSALKACSRLAALRKGIDIHKHVVEDGLESDLFINTTVIDLYSCAGDLIEACRIFNRIDEPDVVSWNAMIAACAQHNEYWLAINCLQDMMRVGAAPNHATFVCILSVCSHAGLVKEGCSHFKFMRDGCGIIPTLEHYDSMVDLFGHGACLDEAEDLLETLPLVPNLTEWTSLLSSCRMHANLSIGRRCLDKFVIIDHSNASGYALMSSIYAQAGMHEKASEMELLRRYANAWKKPARAFIELETGIHEFSVGGNRHPRSKEIFSKLDQLRCQMKEEGYEARVDLISSDVDTEDKEKSLCGHCEKLAIAFGLLCTPSGTTLRVSKNLRVCADCHNASKVISKIEKREIIITDAYRCHRFKDGGCSCKDHY